MPAPDPLAAVEVDEDEAAADWAAAAAAEFEASQRAVRAQPEAEARAETARAELVAAEAALEAPAPAPTPPSEAMAEVPLAPPGRLKLTSVRVTTYSLTDAPGHLSYRLVAQVGPFECATSRCFSEVLKLVSALEATFGALVAQNVATRGLRASVIPSLASLLFFQKELGRHATRRGAEIQAFCDACCDAGALAQSEQLTAFFWPAPASGGGSVRAPDGSIAYVHAAAPSVVSYLTGSQH